MSDIGDFNTQNIVINPSPNNQSKKNKPQETQNNETASTFNNII